MQVAYFPDAPPPGWPQPVVALGNFDGLHRGHLKLLDQVRRRAAERGGTSVVQIFEPHPGRVIRPDKAPPLLTTQAQKMRTFEGAGLAAVAIVRFTHELSRWEPEMFVERVLIDWLRVAEVWVGENFLFGRDRSGTFTLLRALGQDRGFKVEKVEPVRFKDFVVSSTRIRHLIQEGRVDEAAALLGRPYAIEGTVVHGDARGRTLGFPTANLNTENELLPRYGIYATIATIDDVAYRSVSNVGIRPTIGDGRLTIETHLLNFGGARDVYGKPLRLAFVKWLREERAFESLEALKAQIALDCVAANDVFARTGVGKRIPDTA
jgi:riboflavin kinase/FMN adenylyltransferase